ncbi:serine-type D-Ala-D-Ala carboxypeptidase [Solemya pervernicosa gill symbiont]|uniref:serine-type D-Ala-D-Ala carboxypeptidase n=2 Tax=Gammaproteobacteria incertae sedis TaxID=118884 RepID=A0A1T2L4R7_9GAMM|nr:D-alanyl-D-alanine carboxypeptidase family protein [Candidatus Reidiella endopervernicosa]OOZ39926.1 serine-type D-Ala-D-Ala carboxypeptidase [Solemya pervernicosa gill symbiont]QKQ25979.1 D-alanyl-D-alanine carboxypeptidase [Candidatus Reidiella endopervernicosa]
MPLLTRLLTLILFALPTAQAASIVPSPPDVAAKSYVIVDFDSGQELGALNADQQIEPASITKMMTSYVLLHELKSGAIKLDDEVTVSEKAWRAEGSRMFIEVGKRIPVELLLKGMIIQSGNDASIALAEHVAGTEATFAQLMNSHAQRLGLTGTNFMNSTGLPHPDHYTTAHDIATIARALISEFPEHYKWHAEKKFTFNNITQHNRNKLLWRDESVDGIKTGHTESAGYCLVSSAKRSDMRLITVVLGAKSENARATISQSLLNYGFRFYESHKLYDGGKALTQARIWKGATEKLPLGLKNDLYVTIPRGQYKKLKANMALNATITAPAKRGAGYGKVNVTLDGKPLLNRPLIALADVAEGSMFDQLIDDVKMMFE